MFKRIISLALSVVFSLQTCGFAQVAQLNLAGYLGQGSGAPALDRFRPASLRYFSYEPDSDNFKILLDKADEKGLSDVQIKDKADELMRYFRIGLSLPNDKFWVNLRPDAPEQIIDPELERTDIGKIMLEADLQLKKDTSSLTSPQTKEGKVYWDKLYKKAGELFGSENITIPTITRPWIVPGEIIVRQSGNSAYIYKAALKVMLEEDYLTSRGGSRTAPTYQQYAFSDPRLKELNQYSTQLIRELIIPQLTKEVNRAKRYAGLRQVYYSLILARWFKQSYHNSGAKEHQGVTAPVNENNTLAKLIDSGSLTNLTSQEPWSKDTYYQGYKKSFEQGEYNLSETAATPSGQVIRRYISGGIRADSALIVNNHYNIPAVERIPSGANGVFFNYTSSGGDPVVKAAASAVNSKQEENEDLVGAIVYIAERLRGLAIFSDISLHAGGGMEGKRVSSLLKDKDAHFRLKKIIERISEYKKQDPWSIEFKKGSTLKQIENKLLEEAGITASSALTLEEAKSKCKEKFRNVLLRLNSDFLETIKEGRVTADEVTSHGFKALFLRMVPERIEQEAFDLENLIQLIDAQINRFKEQNDKYMLFLLKDLSDLRDEIEIQINSAGSSAVVSDNNDRLGAVDFRAMDMLIQPQGSFRGLDFSPTALSSSALEAMDLEKALEGINLMTLGRRRPHPQRLKEYVSACIFKGKINEKADDFILSMLEVFQLQSEEGIESASHDREAVVLADTRGYVLPEKEMVGGAYSLN